MKLNFDNIPQTHRHDAVAWVQQRVDWFTAKHGEGFEPDAEQMNAELAELLGEQKGCDE